MLFFMLASLILYIIFCNCQQYRTQSNQTTYKFTENPILAILIICMSNSLVKILIIALLHFLCVSQTLVLPLQSSVSQSLLQNSVSYQPRVPTFPLRQIQSSTVQEDQGLQFGDYKNLNRNDGNNKNIQTLSPKVDQPENSSTLKGDQSDNKIEWKENLTFNSGSSEGQTFRAIQRCSSSTRRGKKSSEPQQINLSFRSYIEKYRSQQPDPTSKVIGDNNFEIWQVRSKFSEINVFRELIYNRNLKKINNHNQNKDRRFNMGLNRFTLLDELEFNRLYTTNVVVPSQPRISLFEIRNRIKSIEQEINDLERQKNNLQFYANSLQSGDSTIRSGLDIRKIPILLPIQRKDGPTKFKKSVYTNSIIDWSCISSQIQIYNQGACGSCYAFATLDAIFITAKIQNKTLQPLSVQQILSCAKNDLTLLGCKGGYFTDVFNYVQSRGVLSGLLYKYHQDAREKGLNVTCNQTLLQSFPALKYRGLKGSMNIEKGDCNNLVETLQTRAVAVAISTEGFQFYVSGTYNSAGNQINHGVVLVGYYPQNGFLVKNSWGNTWGEGGYAFVSQQTGICDYAVAPLLL